MFIDLKKISFTYNLNMPFEKEVLKDVNISISDGEFIGIIGHTGCGKTTLLQVLNGLLEPTKGEIYIDNVNIHSNKKILKDVRKKIGLSFQYPENQIFEETIFKEVSFGLKNLGCKEEFLEENVKKALEMVDLNYEYYRNRLPFNLSGGEMRRVAIASILALSPEVIILDEPTASLDPQSRNIILKLIKKLHDCHKKTIIMVSHNMEVIAEMTKRVIVMENGKIVLDKKTREIFRDNSAELEKIGLALPQITKIMYDLKKMGKPVDINNILTIEEAKEEILRLRKNNEIF